jgi:SAM-dependent methyltransferase
MSAAEINTPPDAWLAWRRKNADKFVKVIWPLLQLLDEANKAWMLGEIGALDGSLAHALARHCQWRDIIGFDDDRDLLTRAAQEADDPITHRLDYIRCHVRSTKPHLPVQVDYASGLYSVGVLRDAAEPLDLLAEYRRILRPNGSLILAEPVGGLLSGIAKEWQVALEQLNEWKTTTGELGFQLLKEEKKMGLNITAWRLNKEASG